MDKKNTYYLLQQLRFIMLLAWGICVIGLGYILVGDSLKNFGKRPELVPLAMQGSGNSSDATVEDGRIENGIHIATGLKVGEGFNIVRQTCTGCHSAKLITQNRATRAGWKEMIVWMQKTQGLWDLGPIESDVLDYLSTYYAPEEQGRREPLAEDQIEWYWLEEE